MFDKDLYWKNRKEGKRGQDDAPKKKPKSKTSGEKLRVDNKGEVYSPNRAARHRKLPADPIFTKKTHKIIKERSKHAPSKQQRKRAIAKARKARQADYSQVS